MRSLRSGVLHQARGLLRGRGQGRGQGLARGLGLLQLVVQQVRVVLCGARHVDDGTLDGSSCQAVLCLFTICR